MKFSATQAAKEVGKSVPTITKAIKSGRLSATTLDNGGYEIDASELFRVWDRIKGSPEGKEDALGGVTPTSQAVLEVENKAKDAMIERLKIELDDVKEQRDKWQDQARTLLLQAPANGSNSPRGGFWSLFRKSA